jgi:hypothetical protein
VPLAAVLTPPSRLPMRRKLQYFAVRPRKPVASRMVLLEMFDLVPRRPSHASGRRCMAAMGMPWRSLCGVEEYSIVECGHRPNFMQIVEISIRCIQAHQINYVALVGMCFVVHAPTCDASRLGNECPGTGWAYTDPKPLSYLGTEKCRR